MTDIVERLRAASDLLEVTADNIEFLRKVLVRALQARSDAAATEREECAKLAESRDWSSALAPNEVAMAVAASIRSRGGGA